MRPSGTTGTSLLLLLASLCAAGGALEEKKGKGVSRWPAPPAESARRALAVGAGLCDPAARPSSAVSQWDRGRNWTFRVWNGRNWGGRRKGDRVGDKRGCQHSVGTAAVRSGALDRSQLSCLTFLRSVGVRERKRGAGQRLASVHVRPPSTIRASWRDPRS